MKDSKRCCSARHEEEEVQKTAERLRHQLDTDRSGGVGDTAQGDVSSEKRHECGGTGVGTECGIWGMLNTLYRYHPLKQVPSPSMSTAFGLAAATRSSTIAAAATEVPDDVCCS